MNDKCLLDEFQQKVIEKLSNEVVSIIIKQVESAINNSESLQTEKKTEKFDPNTLQPFDKVLVRDEPKDCWVPTFFWCFMPDEASPAICFNLCWQQCIPYNDDTKHLIGTKEDCPEYYKWWER